MLDLCNSGKRPVLVAGGAGGGVGDSTLVRVRNR